MNLRGGIEDFVEVADDHNAAAIAWVGVGEDRFRVNEVDGETIERESSCDLQKHAPRHVVD